MVFLKDQQTSARQWDSIWFGQRRVFAPETIPELIGQFRRQRRLCYRRHLLCQHAAQRPRAGASRTDVGLLRGGGRGSQRGWKQRGKKTPSTPSNSTFQLTAIDWLTTNDNVDRGLEDLSLKTGCWKATPKKNFTQIKILKAEFDPSTTSLKLACDCQGAAVEERRDNSKITRFPSTTQPVPT